MLPYPAWSPSVTYEINELLKKTSGKEPSRSWVVRPSPDGRWVAVSLCCEPGGRGDIDLRDAATGIVLKTLHVHVSGVVDLGISSDSRFIVSATRGGEICITDYSSGIPMARYNHTDGDITRILFRCKDSEVLLVYADRGHYFGHGRPVHFRIFDWDRDERTEGGLRPKRVSHGLRGDTRPFGVPWSISPDGRWGVLWATGDLLDLHSFDEVEVPFIRDATDHDLEPSLAKTCGTWLSASTLVCSIRHKDGCNLIVVDIGQDIKAFKTRTIPPLSSPYSFIAMEASANGLVALYGSRGMSLCMCLWDPNGDEIRFFKPGHNYHFCLSPRGDALYLAGDLTWSLIPTSQSSMAAAQSLNSRALKFTATRDTIMVQTPLPADDGWELGILARGFRTLSDISSLFSTHYLGCKPRMGTDASLGPDPKWMILPDKEVVLHSKIRSSKTFSAGEHKGYPDSWWRASISSNLSRIAACGVTPDSQFTNAHMLTFAVWDTASASLLHAFKTPRPSLPYSRYPHTEMVVTEDLDIHFLLDHHSFAYRYSDWSNSDPDEPRFLPMPEPGPVPGEWFEIGDNGWVTRSDGHPEVDTRGREKLFWVPPSQRAGLWRGDQHLLAMTTEHDVIVLDLSDFDDDTKEQHVPRLQIENE